MFPSLEAGVTDFTVYIGRLHCPLLEYTGQAFSSIRFIAFQPKISLVGAKQDWAASIYCLPTVFWGESGSALEPWNQVQFEPLSHKVTPEINFRKVIDQ